MSVWKNPVRLGLVSLIVVGVVAVVFFRPDEPQNGWVDCTAPRIQETLPVLDEGQLPDLALDTVAEGVDLPVAVVDLDETLLVGSQTGLVSDALSGEVVLDLTDRVEAYSEQGLLDLAMGPDGDWLYVSYIHQTAEESLSSPERDELDQDGISRVQAWRWDHSFPLDPGDGVDVFELAQPHRNHNGGGIRFGPDGYLYLGFGDGGGHVLPEPERARDLSSLFGSILRIAPTPAIGGYEIPDDNPFVGEANAAPEVLHYGLRNPWRFSFDDAGHLWIADVGNFCYEEIDMVGPGVTSHDFGWPGLEGTYEWALEVDATATPPIYEYAHSGGSHGPACAISGGEVYEGEAIPDLVGVYVFSDVCAGRLLGIEFIDGGIIEYDLGVTAEQPVAVQAAADGELFVISFGDGGRVSRLVPAT